jgi:hypothetical protein
MRTQILLSLLAAVGLLGCAPLERVAPGTPKAQVLSTYGQPTRIVPLAAGERLQYSLQPAGQRTVMVDLDAAGRVISSRQVLQSADITRAGQVAPGRWSRLDAEREFGPPASIDRVADWPGDILTYRWEEGGVDLFFYIYLDNANQVQRTGQGMDFKRDPP